MTFDNRFKCTSENMSKTYLELEMFLHSLFPLTYPEQEEYIIATNGYLEITYTRYKESIKMEIKIISLEQPHKFLIKNPLSLKLNIRNYKVFDIDYFDFEQNDEINIK